MEIICPRNSCGWKTDISLPEKECLLVLCPWCTAKTCKNVYLEISCNGSIKIQVVDRKVRAIK